MIYSFMVYFFMAGASLYLTPQHSIESSDSADSTSSAVLTDDNSIPVAQSRTWLVRRTQKFIDRGLLGGSQLRDAIREGRVARENLDEINETRFKGSTRHLEKRAEKGEIDVIEELAKRYRFGTDGVKKNFKKAIFYYRKVALTGDAEANYDLGMMYLNGETRKEKSDFYKACSYFERAASQNYVKAVQKLAVLYSQRARDFYSSFTARCEYKLAIKYAKQGMELGCVMCKSLFGSLLTKVGSPGNRDYIEIGIEVLQEIAVLPLTERQRNENDNDLGEAYFVAAGILSEQRTEMFRQSFIFYRLGKKEDVVRISENVLLRYRMCLACEYREEYWKGPASLTEEQRRMITYGLEGLKNRNWVETRINSSTEYFDQKEIELIIEGLFKFEDNELRTNSQKFDLMIKLLEKDPSYFGTVFRDLPEELEVDFCVKLLQENTACLNQILERLRAEDKLILADKIVQNLGPDGLPLHFIIIENILSTKELPEVQLLEIGMTYLIELFNALMQKQADEVSSESHLLTVEDYLRIEEGQREYLAIINGLRPKFRKANLAYQALAASEGAKIPVSLVHAHSLLMSMVESIENRVNDPKFLSASLGLLSHEFSYDESVSFAGDNIGKRIDFTQLEWNFSTIVSEFDEESRGKDGQDYLAIYEDFKIDFYQTILTYKRMNFFYDDLPESLRKAYRDFREKLDIIEERVSSYKPAGVVA
jgi:TPR repeat protein